MWQHHAYTSMELISLKRRHNTAPAPEILHRSGNQHAHPSPRRASPIKLVNWPSNRQRSAKPFLLLPLLCRCSLSLCRLLRKKRSCTRCVACRRACLLGGWRAIPRRTDSNPHCMRVLALQCGVPLERAKSVLALVSKLLQKCLACMRIEGRVLPTVGCVISINYL